MRLFVLRRLLAWFVLELGYDLPEDAVKSLLQVPDAGLVVAIVLDDLHDACIRERDGLMATRLQGIRSANRISRCFSSLILDLPLEGILFLKVRNQVLLGYVELFNR